MFFFGKNGVKMEKNKESMTHPRDILWYLLPFVATAGAYSRRIQDGVGTHAEKHGETAFHHALSDADLTVQSYLEVALLARFPEVSFFSEEQAQSLNVKYFPTGAPLEVLLDPIDGTRAYIDNREHYQIIVTIHDNEQIVGALSYMPRLDMCYVAVRGEGARVLTCKEAAGAEPGKVLKLKEQEGPVLLFNSPPLRKLLSPHFEAIDLVPSYSEAPGKHNSTDVLVGKAVATLHTPCQAIDGGAIAFIVEQAGGIVTDFDGNPTGSYRATQARILPEVLVAATREIHDKLLRVLKTR